MTSIISAIKESIAQQNHVWALVNCFATWDESEPDQEVIEQGLIDRARAMGVENPGVLLNRNTILSTDVSVVDMDTSETIAYASYVGTPTKGRSECVSIMHPISDLLNASERKVLEDFMTNKFYH